MKFQLCNFFPVLDNTAKPGEVIIPSSHIRLWIQNYIVKLMFQEHFRTAQASRRTKYNHLTLCDCAVSKQDQGINLIRTKGETNNPNNQTNPLPLRCVSLPKKTVYAKPRLILVQVSSLTTW